MKVMEPSLDRNFNSSIYDQKSSRNNELHHKSWERNAAEVPTLLFRSSSYNNIPNSYSGRRGGSNYQSRDEDGSYQGMYDNSDNEGTRKLPRNLIDRSSQVSQRGDLISIDQQNSKKKNLLSGGKFRPKLDD